MKRIIRLSRACILVPAVLLIASCGSKSSPSSSIPFGSVSADEASGYTVTWKNYDGNVLEIDNGVKAGETPKYDGDTPKRNSDVDRVYVFNGWDPEITPVTSDAIYTAQYSESVRRYAVSWVDYDGTVLDSAEEEYGKMPVYSGTTPNRPDKDGRSYTWTGWKPEIGAVVKDQVYTAVYSASAIRYTIDYVLGDGQNNAANPAFYTIETGATPLGEPTRDGYSFEGWYDSSDFTNRILSVGGGTIGDLVLYAKWTPITYSITYLLNDGTNSADNPTTYTIETEAIRLQEPSKTGNTFLGWFDESGNQVDSISPGMFGDLVLEARWTPTKYGLIVLSEDDSEGTVSIVSGEGYFGETVTVEADPANGCTFVGWYNAGVCLSDLQTYTFEMPAEHYALVARFRSKAETEELLAMKPIISSDGKTVKYGLYPQRRVSEADVLSDLESLTPDSNGWYRYKGEYYAQTIGTPINSWTTFSDGSKIEANRKYWFKCDPIEWDFLSKEDGKALVLSSVLLDVSAFGNGGALLKNHLKNDFYKLAFALNDSYIQSSVEYSETEDKIFSPKALQYRNNDYGFSTATGSTTTRCSMVSDWARAIGGYCNTTLGYGRYWTSTIDSWGSATYVNDDGSITTTSSFDNAFETRPAIVVDIAVQEEAIPLAQRLATEPIYSENKKTVSYGLYPQSRVKKVSLVTALDALDDSSIGENGWYLYEGDYYAKWITNDQCEGSVFNDGSSIQVGATYWFKCEPITWNVLHTRGLTIAYKYVVSSKLLDAHCYNSSLTSIVSNYKTSEIRAWLLNDFYSSAFALNDDYVETAPIPMSDECATWSFDPKGSETIPYLEDKVFFPSRRDYCSSEYGFNTNASDGSVGRYCQTTEWARARGARYTVVQGGDYPLYNGAYWTRSGNVDDSAYVWYVNPDGALLDKPRLYDARYSVRPAIMLHSDDY